MRIEFGTLQDVCGKAVVHGGYTFVPAEVKLAGNGFSHGFHLRDAVGAPPPAILANPIEAQYDAAWVRARLPRVFGFIPGDSDVEKTLLYVGFVAVPLESQTGFPFICTDYYGRTGLMFSPEGPDTETQTKIANTFWSLLLQNPSDLSDFESTVFHPGACIWMHYYCKNGELEYSESEEE
jgi:hypothetical protein